MVYVTLRLLRSFLLKSCVLLIVDHGHQPWECLLHRPCSVCSSWAFHCSDPLDRWHILCFVIHRERVHYLIDLYVFFLLLPYHNFFFLQTSVNSVIFETDWLTKLILLQWLNWTASRLYTWAEIIFGMSPCCCKHVFNEHRLLFLHEPLLFCISFCNMRSL